MGADIQHCASLNEFLLYVNKRVPNRAYAHLFLYLKASAKKSNYFHLYALLIHIHLVKKNKIKDPAEKNEKNMPTSF